MFCNVWQFNFRLLVILDINHLERKKNHLERSLNFRIHIFTIIILSSYDKPS